MKIRRLDVERLELPLKDGYRIAGRTTHSVTNFIVRVTTEAGIDGIGCAAPAEEVTGESDDACESALRGPLSDAVTGLRLSVEVMQSGADPTNVAPAAPAARAAVNMALWDAAACFAGVPLIRLLGAEPRAMPTSVTIGISDAEQVIADAERWLAQGFAILKIKTGDDVDADIDTLHRLRACVGRDVPIRVDANQGYTLAEARRFLTETSRCSVEMLEQPLAASALGDMASLVAESDVPILADEMVLDDASNVIDAGAAHGINIKLMKCGGVTAACRLHDQAHAAGLSVMIGCNDETRVSIAAALHVAQALPGVRYIDLDGHLDLAHDPGAHGFTVRNGIMQLTDRPGLGVRLDG